MRTVFTSALLAASLLFGVTPALADPSVCINTRDIMSQKVENRGASILFKMRDGTQWRNTLKGACPDLVFEGYVWVVRNPDSSVCENEQSMRLLKSGEICMLGKFTKMTPTLPQRPG
jgi:hypothetical protein